MSILEILITTLSITLTLYLNLKDPLKTHNLKKTGSTNLSMRCAKRIKEVELATKGKLITRRTNKRTKMANAPSTLDKISGKPFKFNVIGTIQVSLLMVK